MYSDKDFQTFWFRYKTEGEPHGISINSFCINQGVPYKQFYAWFKKHAKDTVIPVEIEGAPTDEDIDDVETTPQPVSKTKVSKQDDIALLNDMDVKLLLFQTRTNLFWEGCSTYEDMYSDDFELDEEGGMWQWYLERLKADKKQQ